MLGSKLIIIFFIYFRWIRRY